MPLNLFTAMIRKRAKQKNWRLSEDAIGLINDATKNSGLNATQVIEACIAQYASKLPGLSQKARKVLMDVVTRELGADDGKK